MKMENRYDIIVGIGKETMAKKGEQYFIYQNKSIDMSFRITRESSTCGCCSKWEISYCGLTKKETEGILDFLNDFVSKKKKRFTPDGDCYFFGTVFTTGPKRIIVDGVRKPKENKKCE